KITNIGFKTRPLADERVRQIEDVLEIVVPCREPQVRVEHRDAVAHVVEGDAQFHLALPDLVQQPRVVHRDYRLCSKVLTILYMTNGPPRYRVAGIDRGARNERRSHRLDFHR